MSSEGTPENKEIEQIKQKKIEQRLEKLEKENQKLENKIEKLENQNENKYENRPSKTSKGISRREFLKKAGLGTAGLAALASPVSAMSIKSSSFDVFTDSGNTSYFSIGNNGPVNIQNTYLDLNSQNIQNIGELELPVSQASDNNRIWLDASNQQFKVKIGGKVYSSEIYAIPDSDGYDADNFSYKSGGMAVETGNSRVYGYSAQDGYDYLMKDGSSYDFSKVEFELTEVNSFEPDHANSTTFGFYETTTSWQQMSNFFVVSFDGYTSSGEYSNSKENYIRLRSPDTINEHYIGDNPGPFRLVVTIQDNTAMAEIYESGTLASKLSIDTSSVNFNNLPYYGYSSDQNDGGSGQSELYSHGEKWRQP